MLHTVRKHSATKGGVPSATARQRLAVASALAQPSLLYACRIPVLVPIEFRRARPNLSLRFQRNRHLLLQPRTAFKDALARLTFNTYYIWLHNVHTGLLLRRNGSCCWYLAVDSTFWLAHFNGSSFTTTIVRKVPRQLLVVAVPSIVTSYAPPFRLTRV